MKTILPNLDRKYLVRLEISENLDTRREVALVLVFVNSGKSRSIRKLKFPETDSDQNFSPNGKCH